MGLSYALARRGAFLVGLVAATSTSCYSTGDGAEPPFDRFYFPVGLQVSHGGSVLYVVNSDFDLQYNGGTLQSYDLTAIRRDVLLSIKDPTSTGLPHVHPEDAKKGGCPPDTRPPPIVRETGGVTPLGHTCAPPMMSWVYLRDHAIIGAFATDLRLSPPPEQLVAQSPRVSGEGVSCAADSDCIGGLSCAPSLRTCVLPFGARREDRLYTPVRGDATLTWASIERDTFDQLPPDVDWMHPPRPLPPYGPWKIRCGQETNSQHRCNAIHQAGGNPRDNTRGLTMPGEPFGVAMSEDGEHFVITHQNDRKSSLFTTGLRRSDPAPAPGAPAIDYEPPSMQYILDTVPFGGVGVVAVPHDRDAFFSGQPLPRLAFYETSRAAPEVSLLRLYPDQVAGIPFGDPVVQGSSLKRPFLNKEAGFPISVSAGGSDSRGLAIDSSPRIRCKLGVLPALLPGRTQAQVDDELRACARKRARVFIANRTPPALLVGDIGVTEGTDGAYDPDRLVLHTSIPLSAGPSKVYVAPVVERDGTFGMRVFVVCFDSATIFVFYAETQALENVIRTAPGPIAMAFDPFTVAEVARQEKVPPDQRTTGQGLLRYRFAYLASFTQSFVQVLDLDNTNRNPSYQHIVFTLGPPTNPKGT
jgi:hypothetical protein